MRILVTMTKKNSCLLNINFTEKKLIQSLKFKKKNYFKGISCSCCNGKTAVNYMKSIAKDDKNLTHSNLLQNGNYKLFITKMLSLFKKKKNSFNFK